ncbi:MAG: ribonuclease Y [Christensenellaceae bacterium]|nr:ribonuclease Y [Christensenellaceae bacterium]
MLSSLTMNSAVPSSVVAIISIIPSLIAGIACGYILYRQLQKKRKQDSLTESVRIVEEAIIEAKTIRQEAMLETKEEQIRLRDEFEKESKEKRLEIQKDEERLRQKEDMLNRKENWLEKKHENADRTRRELENREQRMKNKEAESDRIQDQKINALEERDRKLKVRETEIDAQHALLAAEANNQRELMASELENHRVTMAVELERVAELSKEEAKNIIIAEIKDEARRDAVNLVKDIEREAREEGDKKAQNIVALAIQRCAVDQTAETPVSVVELPNDEMKGRIIGRSGRNIKALESTTGVDIIIDDTPDVITLSGFDPVRREVARLMLLKLLADGRIHPARIEELTDRVRREMDQHLKEEGESAVFDTGLYGIHIELVKLLGRLKFRTSYGQNVLKHSLEVSHLSGLLASELKADVKVAKRAGLLHDIGKAVDHEFEGTHVQIGIELAKKYGENEKVIHAIAAHHGDIEATTVEAIIVQAADAISGSRPGARRESLEYYVKRLEKLESLANSFAGVEQSYAIQAGREIRVIVKPDQVDDAAAVMMAKDIAKKLESELEYPGQIKVHVIREKRYIEYAK